LFGSTSGTAGAVHDPGVVVPLEVPPLVLPFPAVPDPDVEGLPDVSPDEEGVPEELEI
jgi:hypothetical protein